MKAITSLVVASSLLAAAHAAAHADTNSWPTSPLSLADSLETALRQSPALLKGKQDV